MDAMFSHDYLPVIECQEEMAYKLACSLIDMLPFVGEPRYPAQTRAWPRRGVFDTSGTAIEDIPPEIEKFCDRIAANLLAHSAFDIWIEAIGAIKPYLRLHS